MTGTRAGSAAAPAVDAERLRVDLEELAQFGATADGGVSRCAFSAAAREARRWLARKCDEAGLGFREDAVGNLFLRLEGPDAPPVWTGSHLDTVPNGGRLDGALGVVAGLEVLRRLAEDAVPLTRPVETVAFADEEGTFYGHLGSRALTRGLDPARLEGIRRPDGPALVDALEDYFDEGPDPVADLTAAPGSVHAFVELHVEQGPVLEAERTSIGVVTHFVGVGRGVVRFEGRADHAGTTPMRLRQDALRGAVQLLGELAELPRRTGRDGAVVTCGRVEVAPGAQNVVPAEVSVYLDFRDHERPGLDRLERGIVDAARRAASRHQLSVDYRREMLTDPVPLGDEIPRLIAEVSDGLGLGYRTMMSGASHDAQVMAAVAPTGMIFVPSRDGRSHSPLESTAWVDIERGVRVLLGVVRELASRPA